ncbi:MAG: response regulator [Bacteriovorax sp.]|nr:response regulator [Bacteriovorax sp.]
MNNLVLIVDDEPGVREAIATYLEIEDLMSIEARCGLEALEIIKNNKDIKFIISDVRMPNGDGIFLINELRKLDTVLPFIILVTGQADITREEAIQKGALDMFIKPPDMDKIIALIKKSINFQKD